MDVFGQLVRDYRSAAANRRRDHLTFRGNIAQGRHGWLRLTPAYSLHLVEEILGKLPSRSLVLDPFSGTGTTPLVAASLGMPCHAIDINPFLVWLGNLKVSRFPSGSAQQLESSALRIVERLRRRKHYRRCWVPDIHHIEKWWDTDTLTALSNIYKEVQGVGDTLPTNVAQALKVAFCRAMIESAHVSFGHQSMSFKKPDAGGRGQRRDGNDLDARDLVGNAFVAAARRVAESLARTQPSATAEVFHGDSRDLANVLPSTRYTVVVTSPPYPNRISYVRELRPYMYWLGYLSTGRQAGQLDCQAIGGTWGCATSMLGAWSPARNGQIPYPGFGRMIGKIAEGHRLLGRYVHKYFEDVKTHVYGLRRVLSAGAQCYYTIGNSKFYDTLLPVERIYAALFQDAGFQDVRTQPIRKRTSKKELFEYVLYARMP